MVVPGVTALAGQGETVSETTAGAGARGPELVIELVEGAVGVLPAHPNK
jgi:hypothetical protein